MMTFEGDGEVMTKALVYLYSFWKVVSYVSLL